MVLYQEGASSIYGLADLVLLIEASRSCSQVLQYVYCYYSDPSPIHGYNLARLMAYLNMFWIMVNNSIV